MLSFYTFPLIESINFVWDFKFVLIVTKTFFLYIVVPINKSHDFTKKKNQQFNNRKFPYHDFIIKIYIEVWEVLKPNFLQIYSNFFFLLK